MEVGASWSPTISDWREATVVATDGAKQRALASLLAMRSQEIEAAHPEWIKRRVLKRHLADGRQHYRHEILAVSHRWEQPTVPDTLGAQVCACAPPLCKVCLRGVGLPIGKGSRGGERIVHNLAGEGASCLPASGA